MSERSGQNQNRRELFAGALRYTALGLLTVGGAALFTKRRRLLREGICINDRLCAGCSILGHCTRPEALSAKKVLNGANSGGR
jgi:hypothetical protein